MADVTYDYVPLLQPTNGTCVQTVTAMLVSHYEQSVALDTVCAEMPPVTDEDGHELGTSLQYAASWVARRGYTVDLYSADAIMLDLKWRDLAGDALLGRLEATRDSRLSSRFGEVLSAHYVDSYIDSLTSGASLGITVYFTTAILDELLAEGPFAAGVSYPTLLGTGHAKNTGLRESIADDASKGISSHAVLVYGSEGDNYLLADPWGNPARYGVSKDQLVAAVMAAQWACDNVLFRIRA